MHDEGADRFSLQRSLPSAAYRDPAFFAAERMRVFAREWLCIAREEQVQEACASLVVEIAGESVILVRNRQSELRGFYNVCRHRGTRICGPERFGISLPGGIMGNGTIRCPYHQWTYSLDGELLNAPYLSDEPGFARENFSLHPVAIETWGGFVFANLTPEGAAEGGRTLTDGLGHAPRRLGNYPLADLKTAHLRSYDVAANWKIIFENYNECYHCAGLHPELCEVVPEFRKRGGSHLDWDAGVPHRDGAWTYTASGTTTRKPFAGLNEEEKVRHKGELIYPNVMLSMSAEHGAAFILWPLAHDRTRIECRFLFHPEEIARADFDPSDAIGFWDLVNRQDWAICERVQQGVSSRVHAHGYYAPLEDLSLDIRAYVGRFFSAEELRNS